jgi:4-hydroxy-tetrahydrodipicolinate synthase
MVMDLKGVFPILSIPCDKHGEVDHESLRDEVEWCLENGVDGFFLGQCSELYAFGRDTRKKIVKTVADTCNSKASLAAGCFANNTSEAVNLSKDAENIGADAIFMLGPYMIPGYGGRTIGANIDIVDHYRKINLAVNIPIVAYNTPMGAPGIMPPEKLHKILDECPDIKYMKTGEATISQYLRTINGGIGERVKILCGKSHMNFRFLEAYQKAVGVTACLASCLPGEHVEMWRYFQRGEISKARETWIRKILPIVDLMFIGMASNIRKEALFQMGIIKSAFPARPFTTAVCDDFHKKELSAVLKLLGKI